LLQNKRPTARCEKIVKAVVCRKTETTNGVAQSAAVEQERPGIAQAAPIEQTRPGACSTCRLLQNRHVGCFEYKLVSKDTLLFKLMLSVREKKM
jgi:hypothetical protein